MPSSLLYPGGGGCQMMRVMARGDVEQVWLSGARQTVMTSGQDFIPS